MLLMACSSPLLAKSASHESHASVQRDRLSYAARLRMLNRARLLKKYPVPPVTAQAKSKEKQDAAAKRALRAHNRELIKQHPEWFPGPWKISDSRWVKLKQQEQQHFLSHDRVHNMLEVAIHRMEQQLGKPYVWGGETPGEGFDCSGLVFYAYNKVLAEKLPRTANQMYHYHRAVKVAGTDLRRGDLLFFHIHTPRGKADHMGVYLGDDRFIESPRTGERVRISHLSRPYWRSHFLGARRIVTPETIL